MTNREICPLSYIRDGDLHRSISDNIPDICSLLCQELIDQALTQHAITGDYDNYSQDQHRAECAAADTGSIVFSHDGLRKLDGAKREYIVTDMCGSCEFYEIGEQGYLFTCPYDRSDPK